MFKKKEKDEENFSPFPIPPFKKLKKNYRILKRPSPFVRRKYIVRHNIFYLSRFKTNRFFPMYRSYNAKKKRKLKVLFRNATRWPDHNKAMHSLDTLIKEMDDMDILSSGARENKLSRSILTIRWDRGKIEHDGFLRFKKLLHLEKIWSLGAAASDDEDYDVHEGDDGTILFTPKHHKKNMDLLRQQISDWKKWMKRTLTLSEKMCKTYFVFESKIKLRNLFLKCCCALFKKI